MSSLSVDAKFCPNWENHSEPGTKWIHPSFRKQTDAKDGKDGASGTPANNQGANADNPQLVAARQALKQARKFLKAMVRDAKKQKP